MEPPASAGRRSTRPAKAGALSVIVDRNTFPDSATLRRPPLLLRLEAREANLGNGLRGNISNTEGSALNVTGVSARFAVASLTMRRMFPELARLGGYREYAAPDDLRGVVAALWSYSRPADMPPIPGQGHRLLPDGDLSIAFWTRRDVRGAILEARLALIGPIATPHFFAPEAGLHVDAVRLHPEWSRDVLRAHPREAVDTVLPFDEVSSCKLPHLLRRLTASPTPLADLLDEVRRMSAQAAASRDVRISSAALRRLRASAARFAPIAGALDVSERHLRRLIRQTAGFSPKHLQRMARLGRAIAAADPTPHADWARIALESGYCDQPHMIEESRSLAGCTPAELFKERKAEKSNLF